MHHSPSQSDSSYSSVERRPLQHGLAFFRLLLLLALYLQQLPLRTHTYSFFTATSTSTSSSGATRKKWWPLPSLPLGGTKGWTSDAGGVPFSVVHILSGIPFSVSPLFFILPPPQFLPLLDSALDFTIAPQIPFYYVIFLPHAHLRLHLLRHSSAALFLPGRGSWTFVAYPGARIWHLAVIAASGMFGGLGDTHLGVVLRRCCAEPLSRPRGAGGIPRVCSPALLPPESSISTCGVFVGAGCAHDFYLAVIPLWQCLSLSGDERAGANALLPLPFFVVIVSFSSNTCLFPFLPRPFLPPTPAAHAARARLLSWFLDAPSLVLPAKAAGKDMGMWFGPASAIRMLIDVFPACALRVSVATDGTLLIYQTEVSAASCSPAAPSSTHGHSTRGRRLACTAWRSRPRRQDRM
ncbi:hypothetical protein C8R44DRAFT_869249 [Mycena epipterygia]|nr:hypothetical protein C8R44DRAFT_869249 [Mycena epipterygia]